MLRHDRPLMLLVEERDERRFNWDLELDTEGFVKEVAVATTAARQKPNFTYKLKVHSLMSILSLILLVCRFVSASYRSD